MSEQVDANAQISHEDNGRTLTGVGVSADRLAETMERHAPEPAAPTADSRGTVAADGVVPPAPAPDDKPPTRGQKRFAELTAEREAARAEAAAMKAERETLARELSELKARPAAQTPEPSKAKVPAPSQPAVAAEKFEFPSYADAVEKTPDLSYDQWEIDRMDAYYAWKNGGADIDTRIAQTLQAREAQREAESIMARSHAKGRETYADFDQVLASGPGDIPLHADEAKARARVLMIWKHPQSEHLTYAILKDAALANRLAGLDDIDFGFELSKLVPAAQPSRRPAPAPAPAPYTPVNGNGGTVSTPSAELAGKGYDFDKSGYRERRAAERKAAGRR